jgi:excisionase family DNA binding protein
MTPTPAAASLDLKEAAAFLGIHPATLQSLAASGAIPGAKVGRSWRFLDVDLVAHLRSQYAKPCRTDSTEGKAVRRGTSCSTTRDDAFAQALALPTRKKPRSSTTSTGPRSAPNLVLASPPGKTPASRVSGRYSIASSPSATRPRISLGAALSSRVSLSSDIARRRALICEAVMTIGESGLSLFQASMRFIALSIIA